MKHNERKIYKLVIFGSLGNEERYIECQNQSEAIEIKDMLLNGRLYYSLSEEMKIAGRVLCEI